MERDIDALARTIYGEARGETYAGQVAVAWVVKNRTRDRLKRWPRTYEGVCQQRLQFSCWNADDPNRAKLLTVGFESEAFVRAYGIACLVIAGELRDPSRGANHYMRTDWLDRVKWDNAMERTVDIGAHSFFRG